MVTKPVDFYCSQKFTWLSVDLEKRLAYSCCTAFPEKLDIKWLEQNPGEMFNTPGLHQDRIDMLNNHPVSSCHNACWKPESKGQSSRRIVMNSHVPTHDNINEKIPTQLNITLGSTCNLTCSYCCKQYSSSWYRDLNENGVYINNHDRFELRQSDHVLNKLSHSELMNSTGTKVLIEEISKLDKTKEIFITGGEPFLYNELPDVLNKLSESKNVIVYTGLGVDTKRLKKQLTKIEQRNNLCVMVSAENCGKLYEFNRYSNSYENFLTNLKLLIDLGFTVKFSSTVSNLTIFGMQEFVETFKHIPIVYQLCNDPDFLAVNVLDNYSKEKLIETIELSDISIKKDIIQSLIPNATQEQQKNCAVFVKEFAHRRNLNLDIFPGTMLEWLNHVV
jgi:organic radical activating enzyme